jgi:CPA2 family monovalent cation:H+ antiporter-2
LPALIAHNFLEDLALALCVSAVVSIVFQKLRQPLVVGYLVAGLMVGPHVPFPLVAGLDRINKLSELGVILLMFALGLEFSVRKLVRLAPTAGFITVVQVGLLIWLGYVVGLAFGWTTLESVFAGAILSISSTTIIAKAFAEQKVDHGLAELVFGITLFEDLAAVIILTVLTTVATGAGLSARLLIETVGRLMLFLAALVAAGMFLAPRAIRLAARLERDETLIIVAVGICFAFAMAAEMAGYSVALGAFLAGVMVAESGEGGRVEHLVAPLRDIFGAVFFVSVGMMLNPADLVRYWPALATLVAVVIVGKFAGVGIGALLCGNSTRNSVEAGMAMAQIGEFSFIIAGAGVQHAATREFLYSLAIAVSAITTFSTPFMIRAAERTGKYIDARMPAPLGALQAIYDAWMERLRRHSPPARARRFEILILLAMAAFVAIIICYEFIGESGAAVIASAAGVTLRLADLLVKAVTVGLAAALFGLILHGAKGLARSLAGGMARTAETDAAGEPAIEALGRILQIAIVFAVIAVMLALTAPFLRPVEGAAALVASASAIGILIWRSARDLRGQLPAATELLLRRFAYIKTAPPPAFPAGGERALEAGPLVPIQLSPESRAVGRTLAELNLRALTGAMVVAISRDGGEVILPESGEVLREGDTLALAGATAAIASARAILEARANVSPQAPPQS